MNAFGTRVTPSEGDLGSFEGLIAHLSGSDAELDDNKSGENCYVITLESWNLVEP